MAVRVCGNKAQSRHGNLLIGIEFFRLKDGGGRYPDLIYFLIYFLAAGLNLNFCPPIAASAISPPFTIVKIATPLL